MQLTCNFDPAKYLIFSENIPSLVYYSHFFAILISVILVLLLVFKSGRELSTRLLVLMIAPFVSWIFLDSVFWASNRSDVIMFVWSLQILIEPITYLAGAYLMYVLIKKKDIRYRYKIFLSILYAPLILFTPTKLF